MGDSHISAIQVELSDGKVKDGLRRDQTQDTVTSSEAIARLSLLLSVMNWGMGAREKGGGFGLWDG